MPLRISIPISKCIENFCNMNAKFYATNDRKTYSDPSTVKAVESACKFCITLYPMGCQPVMMPPAVAALAAAPETCAATALAAASPTNLAKSRQAQSTVAKKSLRKKLLKPKKLPAAEFCCYCQHALPTKQTVNDEQESRMLNLKETPSNSVASMESRTRRREANQGGNSKYSKTNKNVQCWDRTSAALTSKCNCSESSSNDQQTKAILPSRMEEVAQPITLSETTIKSDQIIEDPAALPSSSRKRSFGSRLNNQPSSSRAPSRTSNTQSEYKTEYKNAASPRSSQATSIKSEALKELLTSIEEPIINSIVDRMENPHRVSTVDQVPTAVGEKPPEESERFFSQLVRNCNAHCEKTFLATQEILRRLTDVDKTREPDAHNSSHRTSVKAMDEHAERSNVEKPVNGYLNQTPKRCSSNFLKYNEIDSHSLSSDKLKSRARQKSLNLKLCRLKEDHNECLPTLIEYSVEAITRCPPKATDSKVPLDSNVNLMSGHEHLNDSNVDDILEDMEKCCHQLRPK